jgi:hypothetical protein
MEAASLVGRDPLRLDLPYDISVKRGAWAACIAQRRLRAFVGRPDMDYMDDKSPPRFCLQKCSALEVLESPPELLLRVHYYRAEPGHRLFERLS